MQPYNCRIHFCQEFLCMAWEQHEQPATHGIKMCCWKGLIKRFASSNMYLLRTWIIDTLASQTQGQKPSPSHGLYDLHGWDSNQPQMVLVALVSHIWYKLEHRFPKISHCFNIVLGYNGYTIWWWSISLWCPSESSRHRAFVAVAEAAEAAEAADALFAGESAAGFADSACAMGTGGRWSSGVHKMNHTNQLTGAWWMGEWSIISIINY